MADPNPPWRHHFLPQFFLEGWTVEGKLVQYERTNGRIVRNIRTAKGAGFAEHLYEMAHSDRHMRQATESAFLVDLDFNASVALKRLNEHGVVDLPDDLRGSWSLFVSSLFLRSPERLNAFVDQMAAQIDISHPALQIAHESLDVPGVDACLPRAVADNPSYLRKFIKTTLPTQLIDPIKAARISAMKWDLVTIRDVNHSLMLSDDPIRFSWIGPTITLMFPLTPFTMFVASDTPRAQHRLRSKTPSSAIRSINRLIVEQAFTTVISRDARHEAFVHSAFGTKPAPYHVPFFRPEGQMSPWFSLPPPPGLVPHPMGLRPSANSPLMAFAEMARPGKRVSEVPFGNPARQVQVSPEARLLWTLDDCITYLLNQDIPDDQKADLLRTRDTLRKAPR